MFIDLTVLEARSPKWRCGQDCFLERDMKENLFMPLSSLLKSSAFLPFLYITLLLCMSTSVPKCLTLYKWDRLGPGTFHCSDCTCTHLLCDKIQINYMGLKITVCMHGWGRFWKKDPKRPKSPIATFEEPGAKLGVGNKGRVLSMPPAHTTT